jgi:UDP-glucose 4-epimerase
MIEDIVLTLRELDGVGDSFNVGNARAVATIFGSAEAICRMLRAKWTAVVFA